MNLAPLKIEGAAVHPDEMGELSDEQYKRQLTEYYRTTGDTGVFCSRLAIAQKVIQELNA